MAVGHSGGSPGAPGGWKILNSGAVWRDCHADAHDGQLAKRDHGGACESCHKVDGWKPSTFSVAEHARLRLPLDGRHRRVDCAAYHGPARKGLPALPPSEKLGSARVALVLGEVECAACHVAPHEGRFGPAGARPKADSCIACHGLDAFRPSKVDIVVHGSFDYPLRGAHRAIPCDACHAESKTPPMKATLVLAYVAAYGFSPDAEPTPRQLYDLSEMIKQKGIKYLFYEELLSPRVAETIAKETGATLLKLSAAHNITKDELMQNVCFISIMEQNLKNLATGLQCQ